MPFASLRSTVVLATALTFLVKDSVASPALPPSLRSHPADSRHDHQLRYVYRFDTRYNSKRGLTASRRIDQDETTVASPALAYRSTSQDSIDSLKPSFNKSMSSSKQLSANAAVASTKGGDKAFQQQNSDSLSDFQGGLLEFQGLLSQLAADKGLANYDKGDELETMLKNIVNATKNTLSATDILVYRIPLLGPLLGPIVYQIKCIIDDLLDAVENITDGLLNDLAPLLRGLDNQIVDLLCGPLLDLPILSATSLCPSS